MIVKIVDEDGIEFQDKPKKVTKTGGLFNKEVIIPSLSKMRERLKKKGGKFVMSRSPDGFVIISVKDNDKYGTCDRRHITFYQKEVLLGGGLIAGNAFWGSDSLVRALGRDCPETEEEQMKCLQYLEDYLHSSKV